MHEMSGLDATMKRAGGTRIRGMHAVLFIEAAFVFQHSPSVQMLCNNPVEQIFEMPRGWDHEEDVNILNNAPVSPPIL